MAFSGDWSQSVPAQAAAGGSNMWGALIPAFASILGSLMTRSSSNRGYNTQDASARRAEQESRRQWEEEKKIEAERYAQEQRFLEGQWGVNEGMRTARGNAFGATPWGVNYKTPAAVPYPGGASMDSPLSNALPASNPANGVSSGGGSGMDLASLGGAPLSTAPPIQTPQRRFNLGDFARGLPTRRA